MKAYIISDQSKEVLMRAHYEDYDVVLCYWHGNALPFVVWDEYPNGLEKGDYFTTYKDALNCFLKRNNIRYEDEEVFK